MTPAQGTRLGGIIRALTGRSYDIDLSDLGYLIDKGGWPTIRGMVWRVFHGGRGAGLLLGRDVRILKADRLSLGRGVSIGDHGYVECSARDGVRLEDGVTLRESCWIQCRSGLNEEGVGLFIGARAYVGPFAILGVGGPIHIGAGTQIGARLAISAESHQAHDGDFVSGAVLRRGVRIGERCWIGNNVTIIDGVEVGDGAVIGAGAVVTRSIPSGATAAGVPARIIRPSAAGAT